MTETFIFSSLGKIIMLYLRGEAKRAVSSFTSETDVIMLGPEKGTVKGKV